MARTVPHLKLAADNPAPRTSARTAKARPLLLRPPPPLTEVQRAAAYRWMRFWYEGPPPIVAWAPPRSPLAHLAALLRGR